MNTINPKKPPKIKPKNKEKLVGDNPEQWIPFGLYCYDEKGICPYWDKNKNQEYQFDGYCHFLKTGDWIDDNKGGTWLLWDQCKECGINED